MTTSKNVSLQFLSQVTSTYFNTELCGLTEHPQNEKLKRLAFGFAASDEQLFALCGAPSGSNISLEYVEKQTNPKLEVTPRGVKATVSNSFYFDTPMEIIFFALPTGQIGIYIKLLMAKKNKALSAVGALVLHVITKSADAIFPSRKRKLGQLEMLAAGGRTWKNMSQSGDRWDGFAVWARYGFDMPLRSCTTAMFQNFPYFPRVNGVKPPCVHLSQLLVLEGGLKFWDIVGDGWYMSFDPKLGSDSRSMLDTYLKGKYQ